MISPLQYQLRRWLPRTIYTHLFARLVFLILFGFSLSLVWWSMTDRFAKVRKTQSQIQAVFQLDRQVQQEGMKFAGPEGKAFTARFESALGHLFSSTNEVETWKTDWENRAEAAGFHVTFLDHPMTQGAETNYARLLPVSLSFEPLEQSPDSPAEPAHQRLTKLLLNASHQKAKRAELVEFNASGGGLAITNLQTRYHLWLKKEGS